MDHTTLPVLLSIGDMGRILGLGPKAIYVRIENDPGSLPPRFILPGSNLLRWHPTVVQRWLDAKAGLIAPTALPPPSPRRRPGRPTKEEQIERQRGGSR